jgi:methionyl-tRNA formyltransferase
MKRRREHIRTPFKIILYLGAARPFAEEMQMPQDYGVRLIHRLKKNGHTLAGLLLAEDDPIRQSPVLTGEKKFFLPEVLTLPKPQMEAMLAKEEEISKKLDVWFEEIRKLDADLGIVFYGNWVPPKLSNIPKAGFINYHPGPLPFLKGIEPDTFIILEGWRKVWGAVNRVEGHFDCGSIVAVTKTIKVSKYATPVEVLHALTALGVEAIIRAIKNIAKNKPSPIRLAKKEGSSATFAMAKRESFISWEGDTGEMLSRRLRAFCGQDIKVRLKASINGKLNFVYDLETYRIRKKYIRSFKAGELLGFYLYPGKYYRAPIIKTIDGLVVLLAEEAAGRAEGEIPFPKEHILAPKKRTYITSRRGIKRSILERRK